MDGKTLLESVCFDRTSSVPLHHQLFLELQRLLTQGQMKPGTALPQVTEICRTLGISTITASRAIGELKREGLLVTRRGAGIFVAERPSPVTEIIMGQVTSAAAAPGTFLYPLVEGIKKELDDPHRRCILTYYDEQPPSVQELRDLMRSRHADSLIAFRPMLTVIHAVHILSRDYPAVIVFARPQGWPGDSVLPVPEKALRLILGNRLNAGNRRFYYLGKKVLRDKPDYAESPYQRLSMMFEAVMTGARAESKIYLQDDASAGPASAVSADSVDRLLAGRVRDLPPGTVVVADTPHVAAQALNLNPGLDLIAYTEAAYSVVQFKGRITLLYCGLDKAGETAAKLLRERLANPQTPPRTVELDAQIVNADRK